MPPSCSDAAQLWVWIIIWTTNKIDVNLSLPNSEKSAWLPYSLLARGLELEIWGEGAPITSSFV